MHLLYLMFILHCLVRQFGGHHLVQQGILREVILKWKNHIAVKQQPFALAALRDVGKLIRRNA